jgi:hypothetical protein
MSNQVATGKDPMTDGFDESEEPVLWHRAHYSAKLPDGSHKVAAAKLVSRLYRAAKPPLLTHAARGRPRSNVISSRSRP